MPLAERRARWESMIAPIRTQTIRTWCESFISSLRNSPRANGSVRREPRRRSGKAVKA